MTEKLRREESDRRTGAQWVRSVQAYLSWRAGDAWRNLSNGALRGSQVRREYLQASRTIERAFNAPIFSKEPPVLLASPSPKDKARRALSTEPRKWLVAELQKADPTLTDERMLLHLPRPKLARMLAERIGPAAVASLLPAKLPRRKTLVTQPREWLMAKAMQLDEFRFLGPRAINEATRPELAAFVLRELGAAGVDALLNPEHHPHLETIAPRVRRSRVEVMTA